MATAAPIYLDHHATTPLDPRVLEAMLPYLRESFGNAASRTHRYGWEAEAAVEGARERIAAAIGACDPAEIVFTSGATESDNLALKGIAWAARDGRPNLVTTAIEHPAVLDTCRALGARGCGLIELGVDHEGCVDLDELTAAIDERTLLVSVIAASSEIGVLQPLAEIAERCRARGALFHSDAAQAVGRIPLDVESAGVDLLSFSAHKLYGPKGVGALYLRRRRPSIRVEPLLHGGGHEHGLRSGTLPVALVVGFAKALELCRAEMESEAERLRALRERLWQRLRQGIPDLRLNGHPERRLPGNLNVSIDGIDGVALLMSLPDLALSQGSACASAQGSPSHVLRAIGCSEAQARGALRFGLGRGTTEAQIECAAGRIAEAVAAQRAARGGAALPRNTPQ